MEATIIWFVIFEEDIFHFETHFFLLFSLDNSEWMRNGDFAPSRLISQSEAAILLSTKKTNQNAESAVAVISMAGKGLVLDFFTCFYNK